MRRLWLQILDKLRNRLGFEEEIEHRAILRSRINAFLLTQSEHDRARAHLSTCRMNPHLPDAGARLIQAAQEENRLRLAVNESLSALR